jgi:GT2 family glycosyltransferase
MSEPDRRSDASTEPRQPLSTTVDVLLVNYRTPTLTLGAMAELAGPGVTFFVRDNSGDLDDEALARIAGVSPLHIRRDGENRLYARGNNELFALGSSGIVLLINPDVVLTRSALEILVHALGRDERVWAVVPRLFNGDGTPQDYYRRFPSLLTILCDRVPLLQRILRAAWRSHTYADLDPTVVQPVEAPPGACLVFRRDSIDGDLFDDQLTLFYNDTDLCLRMQRQGRSLLLEPAASAVHIRGASLALARASDRWFVAHTYDTDCLAYARKHLPAAQIGVVTAVVMGRRVAELTARTLQRMRSKGRARVTPSTSHGATEASFEPRP